MTGVDLTSRIVLGTVQLGLPYGRKRTSPVMSDAEAFEMLDAAWNIGVRAFDTAEAYGSSAERLRAWSDRRGNADAIRIVTKFAVDSRQTLEEVSASAGKALSRFQGIGDLTLLTHGPVGREQWAAPLMASAGHHAALGQSVYSPEEVRAACELPRVERIQLPGNVLVDQSIRARGDSAVNVDVRSIYVQGVLLDDPELAEARAPGSGKIVAAVSSAAAAVETALAPLLIATVLSSLGSGDRVVVGVDRPDELDVLSEAFEIADEKMRQFQQQIRQFAEDPDTARILDPRWWPQLQSW